MRCQIHSRAARAGRDRDGGFTLAELIVASTLITFVMASVYTALNSTLRARSLGEADQYAYQDARLALGAMARELNCVMGGTEHLFEGTDDEFAFFAVTPPMNPKDGRGPRLMWIKYRYNRSTKILYRHEAVVESPLPAVPKDDEEVDRSRIKTGRTHKFEFAVNVRRFNVSYWWIPPLPDRKPDEPPVTVEPVLKEENRAGWGLPQCVEVSLTIVDPHRIEDPEGDELAWTTFTEAIRFNGPTTAYNVEKLGEPFVGDAS